MRRELSTVLDELRDGLVRSASHAGLRLTSVDMTLPMDLLAVCANGGIRLLAEVPRGRGDDPWRADASRLHISWQALPRDEVPT
ncbi:MAG: hypothetical protein IV105_06565 [Rhizobacter sp.]|nr:hypothetical protein [Rhizobacter sp.]